MDKIAVLIPCYNEGKTSHQGSYRLERSPSRGNDIRI